MDMSLIRFVKKVLKYLNKKYLSFPTLNFLISTNNRIIKIFYINFWVYVSKRNKSFKNFFFDKLSEQTKNDQIVFNLNNKIDNLNTDCLKSLSHNGILILENALSENEHENIVDCFKNIIIKQNTNYRSNNSIIRYLVIERVFLAPLISLSSLPSTSTFNKSILSILLSFTILSSVSILTMELVLKLKFKSLLPLFSKTFW